MWVHKDTDIQILLYPPKRKSQDEGHPEALPQKVDTYGFPVRYTN